MITRQENADGVEVYAGDFRICVITHSTDKAAVDKFMALCRLNEDKLTSLKREYEARVADNFASGGNGRSYPIFTIWERTITKLCREAGIVDT